MFLSTALCAAVGALATGTAALWANAKRPVNRALAIFSLGLAVWFVGRHVATAEGSGPWIFNFIWTLAGFFFAAWIALREMLGGEAAPQIWRRARAWAIVPAAYALLAFGGGLLRGGPAEVVYSKFHYILLAAGLVFTAAFAANSVLRLRGAVGERRLNLQLVALGGTAFLFALHAFPLVGAVLGEPTWVRLMPLATWAIFSGVAWSLVTVRVLDARHILTLLAEKFVLLLGVAIFVWGVEQVALQFVPSWLAFVLSLGLGLWFAAEAKPFLQDCFQRKTRMDRLRRDAFDLARKTLRADKLTEAFEQLLREWGNTERASILMASQGRLIGGDRDFALDRPEFKLLQSLRWATPERLERERPREHAAELIAWMREQDLGAVIVSAAPALSFVVGVGVPRPRRPYIYPEIAELAGIQSTVESALSRAHYLMKAQHAEQLATVGLLGASLAHEIRNPLVSIKTFVQLLPHRYQDAAFREKFFHLIGDEVGRIDRLTEQLLDLSAPRTFNAQPTPIHPVLANCVELIGAKAEDKGVSIFTDFKAQNDVVYTDPNAVKQVVLNLAFNAIQALEQRAGERLVKLTTAQTSDTVEIAIVDNGPGIAPEIWNRLFQPFQTTKSSGFGLGLAICKDILSSLHASIVADPPSPGGGATFRIVLPCQPPTS